MKLNGIITKRGLELNKTKIIEKYKEKGYKKLLRKFLIRYKSPIGTFFIEKKNYKIEGDTVIFPRFGASDLLDCKIINSIENLIPEGKSINITYTGTPTYNQKVIIEYIFKNIYNDENKIKGNCGLTLNAQAGCHKIDTEIMMYDGTVKMVQDIKIGELLMGDDSTPRKVLKLCRGNEMMYKISNVKNESYIVNENHILALIYTRKKHIIDNYINNRFLVRWFDKNNIKIKSKIFSYKNQKKEDILQLANKYLSNVEENLKVDIKVNDYLKLSMSMQKALCGYKSPVIFPHIDLPLDPYMIGFWLGDSNQNTSVITTQDATIINYFQKNLAQYKCYLQYCGGFTKYNDEKNNEYCYRINGDGSKLIGCNYFLNTLKELNLINNKHIPYIYKCNSRENRLKLLAGILDADGNLSKGGFEFSQSIEHEQIIDDVIYLCRSLGFACYKNKKKTSWTYGGIKKYGEAWRICINGEGIEEIPTLCPRKKANPRQRDKNMLISNITVEKFESDNYYGFQLDGNHRYLMGDFTTLHNSGKTFTAMNVINRLKTKTLIVVPNTYLLTQWVELLEEFFPNNIIGQYYGKEKKDGDIVVAIINSLINDDFTFTSTQLVEIEEIKKGKSKIKVKKEKTIITKSYKEYFKEFGFVILDESHIYCTDSFKVVYNRFQSTYMLGLSATPNERTNNCDIISHLNIGKVLIASEIENYQNDNTKFSAVVSIVKYNGPDKYTNIHINETTRMICVPKIIEEIVNDEYRNKLIIDQIYELFDLKLNIFVFSERRSHLEHLYEQFNCLLDEKFEENETNNLKKNLSIPELDINKNIVLYGNSSEDDVNTAKTNSNVIFTTYAYSSTGVSINRMTAMILATGRRSKSVQIIGRIFRLNNENNHIKRVIVDIVDNKSVLKNQLYERMKAYKQRDAEITTKIINYSDIIF